MGFIPLRFILLQWFLASACRFPEKARSGQEALMRGSWATLCCKCSGNNSALTCWQTKLGLNCALPINEMLHYLNEKRAEPWEELTSLLLEEPTQTPPPPAFYYSVFPSPPSLPQSSSPSFPFMLISSSLLSFYAETFLISTPVLYFFSASSHGII